MSFIKAKEYLETYGLGNKIMEFPVSSATVEEAAKAVADAGASVSWDAETEQNYAKWTADGKTYQIWLEDGKSIESKLKVMKEYDLAGAAAWKLGFETSDIWDIMAQYLN